MTNVLGGGHSVGGWPVAGMIRAALSRRDEDQLGLPAVEVLDAVGGQGDALLQRHPHALAAPLGHRPAHGELQRVDGVGVHGVVAGPADAALLVPLADRRPGAVAVDADRVGVDVGVDALRGGRRAGRRSTSLPVRPGPSSAVVRSCMRLPAASARRSPAGAAASPGRST